MYKNQLISVYIYTDFETVHLAAAIVHNSTLSQVIGLYGRKIVLCLPTGMDLSPNVSYIDSAVKSYEKDHCIYRIKGNICFDVHYYFTVHYNSHYSLKR